MKIRYHFLRLIGYKTFAEMYKELQSGKKKEISYKDGQKSAALERALYPNGIRYLKTGDIYIATEDAEINYVTHWMKPYTGGEKSNFPQQDQHWLRVKIEDMYRVRNLIAHCGYVSKDEFEMLKSNFKMILRQLKFMS